MGTSLFLRLTTAGTGMLMFFAAVKWRRLAGTRLLRLTGSGANCWRRSQSQVVCLAAHTTAHSRKPPPPTDLVSPQLKDCV